VAAPLPACRPNVYGSVLVQLTEKPPPVALATAACSDVYAKSTAVTADSVHADVSVTFTVNVPEVLPACALPAVSAAAIAVAVRIRFIAPSLYKIGRAMLPALQKSAVTYGVSVVKKRRSAVTYATTCAKYSSDKKIKCSDLQSEGCEAGFPVVIVLIFRPLQSADDLVGEGCENDLHCDLQDELRQHELGDDLVWHDAAVVESQRIEKRRVHRLPHDRRAYGARPQPPAGGEDLHLREHERIDEFAAEVGEHRCRCDAPGAAKGGFV